MIYLIQGPTASGKTTLAIQVAKHFNTEIVSADSRQFYRELNIGSAKPSSKELNQIKHHFIDNRSLDDPMNVASFESEARIILNQLIERQGVAVVTGGSTQFIDALVYGIDQIPVFPSIQQNLKEELEVHGINYLQSRLKELDDRAYALIDIQNTRRLMRALEVVLGTGVSILTFQNKQRVSSYPIKRFYIQWDRADLYSRINDRVEEMIHQGLEEEVRLLWPSSHETVHNTVGYKEWDMLFKGTSSKKEVIEKIKQNTRNYAKRQLTWMNQYEDLIPLNPYSRLELIDQVLTFADASNPNKELK